MRRSVVATALVLGLCGCGGGGDEPAATDAAASATQPTTPEAPPTSAEAPTAAATPDSDPSGDVCDFLEQEAPTLESVGSEIGALARFTGDYATWVGEDPSRTFGSASDLDAVTSEQCPDVAARVLAALGAERFAGTV